jgi:hypothetical protein
MVDAAVNKNFIPMKLGPFWSDEMIHTARGTRQNDTVCVRQNDCLDCRLLP